MQEFIFRFKVRTPDGGQEYHQTFLGGESEARSAAKKLCEIYNCNVYIFHAIGSVEIESYDCKAKFVTAPQEVF